MREVVESPSQGVCRLWVHLNSLGEPVFEQHPCSLDHLDDLNNHISTEKLRPTCHPFSL